MVIRGTLQSVDRNMDSVMHWNVVVPLDDQHASNFQTAISKQNQVWTTQHSNKVVPPGLIIQTVLICSRKQQSLHSCMTCMSMVNSCMWARGGLAHQFVGPHMG